MLPRTHKVVHPEDFQVDTLSTNMNQVLVLDWCQSRDGLTWEPSNNRFACVQAREPVQSHILTSLHMSVYVSTTACRQEVTNSNFASTAALPLTVTKAYDIWSLPQNEQLLQKQ